MKFKIAIAIIFLSFTSKAQIIVNEKNENLKKKEEPKEEPKKKEEKKTDTLNVEPKTDQLAVYLEFAPGKSVPTIESNSNSIFSKPVGERANEIPEKVWSYSVGLRFKVNNFIKFQTGIGLMKNRESYSFKEQDTSYSYTTDYNYIYLPIKLFAEYHKVIDFKLGAGIMAQMLTTYKQTGEYKTVSGNQIKFENAKKDGLNPLIVSAVFSAGFSYRFSDGMSIFFVPEYRYQLSSTYIKNHPYIHKVNALTFNFGLYFHM